mmetsp:Transcript_2259/g.6110  ORF Transcript_2259/g.6110 Transcript_2259/m.6110 type:complete len:297 (+) Transcript_2259:779-1669(+)
MHNEVLLHLRICKTKPALCMWLHIDDERLRPPGPPMAALPPLALGVLLRPSPGIAPSVEHDADHPVARLDLLACLGGLLGHRCRGVLDPSTPSAPPLAAATTTVGPLAARQIEMDPLDLAEALHDLDELVSFDVKGQVGQEHDGRLPWCECRPLDPHALGGPLWAFGGWRGRLQVPESVQEGVWCAGGGQLVEVCGEEGGAGGDLDGVQPLGRLAGRRADTAQRDEAAWVPSQCVVWRALVEDAARGSDVVTRRQVKGHTRDRRRAALRSLVRRQQLVQGALILRREPSVDGLRPL